MTPIIILALTIIGALIHLFISKQPRTSRRVVEVFLLYFLVIAFGLGSLFGAFGHIFYADQVAKDIGWPAGSPFQFEVGAANLGIGIAGILCIWFRRGFWASTAITAGTFYFLDGIGHIRETQAGDHAAYNAGATLYVDFIIPIVTWGLLLAYHRITGRAFVVESEDIALVRV